MSQSHFVTFESSTNISFSACSYCFCFSQNDEKVEKIVIARNLSNYNTSIFFCQKSFLITVQKIVYGRIEYLADEFSLSLE